MRKHKNKIIAGAVILILLSAAFWWGGNAPGLHGWNVAPKSAPTAQEQGAGTAAEDPDGAAQAVTAEEKLQMAEELATAAGAEPQADSTEHVDGTEMQIDPSTGKDAYNTDPVPAGKPVPVEPEQAEITDTRYTCTLSVSCKTILNHMDWLDPEKTELVPADGVILPPVTATFYEGESVFNVLQREMKRHKIHMEFTNTPMYNSAYIEGINNLYQFDCGELSGWMYAVNGWFPNYGCSRYHLQDGDKIEWVYTCDLGIDVGGYYAAGQESPSE